MNQSLERPVILEFERADRMRDALDRVRLAVGKIVARIDLPRRAGTRMRRVDDAYSTGSRRLMLPTPCRSWRAAPSAPLGNSPARMRRNRSRFSSTVRSRNGEFLPGSVSVPRAVRMSSCDWSST